MVFYAFLYSQQRNGTTMDDVTDDKIVHARILLRKFQSKQCKDPSDTNNLIDTSTTAFPHPNNAQSFITEFGNNNNSSCAGSQGSISQLRSRDSSRSRPDSVVHNHNGINAEPSHEKLHFAIDGCIQKNFENIETTSLRDALMQKQQELNEALSKLQSLHKHYAELHSAYNQLSSQQSTSNDALSNAYTEQMQQLRTALAAALDEKTKLQAELREFYKSSLTIKPDDQQYNPSICYEIESRLEKMTSERDHLLERMASQSAQIEHQRKECSNLEAKLVLVQQDRVDTQVRIKALYAEKAELERRLDHLSQELGMRDIYVRQLTRNASTNQQQCEPNVELEPSQNGGKRIVEAELERCRAELAGVHKQVLALREQYQMAAAESTQRLHSMESELSALKQANKELESANGYLEEHLRLLRAQLDSATETKVKTVVESQQLEAEEWKRLQFSVQKLETIKADAEARINEIEQHNEQKEHTINALKHALDEAQLRIAELERQEHIYETMNTDVALLSAQLQNEKATVSRAVAQNQELKSQLMELQNRLVQVINESAAKEDERLSALSTVERLQQVHRMTSTGVVQHSSAQSEDAETAEKLAESPTRVSVEQQTDLANNAKGMRLTGTCSAAVQTEQEQSPALQSEGESKIGGGDVELLRRENAAYRAANEKLEYWLTALESENESIGEYIALYRFQRCNIQKRMAEKEAALEQLQQQNSKLIAQLAEVHNSAQNATNDAQHTQTTGCVECRGEMVNL